MENKELIEELASMEHARWSRWQEYLHSKCAKNPDGSLTIPQELVIRWERQISTPYSQLSEREKESDRKEVRPYIELAVLADKQGYMRGVEDALRVLPSKMNLVGVHAYGSGQGRWNAAIDQAHDAISKLKGV